MTAPIFACRGLVEMQDAPPSALLVERVCDAVDSHTMEAVHAAMGTKPVRHRFTRAASFGVAVYGLIAWVVL